MFFILSNATSLRREPRLRNGGFQVRARRTYSSQDLVSQASIDGGKANHIVVSSPKTDSTTRCTSPPYDADECTVIDALDTLSKQDGEFQIAEGNFERLIGNVLGGNQAEYP